MNKWLTLQFVCNGTAANVPGQTQMYRMREDTGALGWFALAIASLEPQQRDIYLQANDPTGTTAGKALSQLEESVPWLLGPSLTVLGGEDHDSPFMKVT